MLGGWAHFPARAHFPAQLLNLLLIGLGVSNVFDGDRDLGGMVMKGVHAKPALGYLSELEALRYAALPGCKSRRQATHMT